MSDAGSDSDHGFCGVEAEPYLNLPAAARLRDGESIDEFRQRTIFRQDLHCLPSGCFACDDPSSSEQDDEEMAEVQRAPPHPEARRTSPQLDHTPALKLRMLARTIEGDIPSSNRGCFGEPGMAIGFSALLAMNQSPQWD